MRRKDRRIQPRPLATSTAERIGAIVEAAERAAAEVIDDAEAQARRHLDQAEAEADRLVGERLTAISELTGSLVAQAEALRREADRLLDSLGHAEAEAEAPAAEPHLKAVSLAEDAPPGAVGPVEGSRTPAGARLLATQMAVSGSSREEIATRLRSGFEIEDTTGILDAILGPED